MKNVLKKKSKMPLEFFFFIVFITKFDGKAKSDLKL